MSGTACDVAPDPTARLPVELLGHVFDELGQPDVLRAARVSPRWRAIATQNDSYYCATSLHAGRLAPSSVAWHLKVAIFCNTLRYCCRRNIKLAVRISTKFDPSAWIVDYSEYSYYMGDDRDGYAEYPSDEEPKLFVGSVFPAVAASIAHTVRLDIDSSYFNPSTLSSAAPKLRFLSLNGFTPARPQPDLFAGCAPRLTHVELENTWILPTAFPAFNSVQQAYVGFCFEHLRLHEIVTHFPNATHLSIRYGGISRDADANEVAPCLLPRVEKLFLKFHSCWSCPDDLRQCLEERRFALLDVNFASVPHEDPINFQPFLQHLPHELQLSLDRDTPEAEVLELREPSEVTAQPSVRRFRMHVDLNVDNRIFACITFLQDRLTDVRIKQPYLEQFMSGFRHLPLLSTLSIRIDNFEYARPYLWCAPRQMHPGRWSTYRLACDGDDADQDLDDDLDPPNVKFMVDCPRLTMLNIYAMEPPVCFASTRELANLARDLSLLPKGARDRPRAFLGLWGVELWGNPHLAISRSFYEVRGLDPKMFQE